MSDKNEIQYIISQYNDYSILPDTYSTSIFSLFTVYFLIQKISDNLMAKWQACFYPMYLLCAITFIQYFLKIVNSEMFEDEEIHTSIKIPNFERVVLISNFFRFLYSPL